MRALLPEAQASVTRAGVDLGYEMFGAGDTTVMLLPTWTIIHSRFWKMQVPYLARYHRVITYDGPGNGRSSRATDPSRYAPGSYAEDAIAILDECGVERAVVVGLSMGGQYGVTLAASHPDRVAGLVLIGPALPLTPPRQERTSIATQFTRPYPENPQGWDKYNLAYWHDHYEDFTRFFFHQVFSEPHSTKPHEDAVEWASGAGPGILEAEAMRPRPETDGTPGTLASPEVARAYWSDVLASLDCPVLVVHGTDDRIQPHEVGVVAADLTGGALVSMEGSGHMPNVRDPVRFNLAVHRFIEGLRG